MFEETTTYQTFIQIFIVVTQNIRTNFSVKICRLLVEEGILLARLAPQVFLTARVVVALSVAAEVDLIPTV
jgi:hypothetical protein